MLIFINFLPILLFICLYVGCGLYFVLQGVDNAFYQVSPTVAIIPAIVLAWLLHKGPTKEKMTSFLDGVRHRDIITMCLIFMLSGAFSMVTKAIGSVDATVNLALSFVPPEFLLVGIFITSAFISTAIGTSMGTIATLAPLAAGLAVQGAFPPALGMATVIGGAMFGDNLSLISDTTIAAVSSQEADFRLKFKLNLRVALIAGGLTIALLLLVHTHTGVLSPKPYNALLIVPYVFLITLAVLGVNVFTVLILALLLACSLGVFNGQYSLVLFSKNLTEGFQSMHDIMLLSLLVGGLSGLASHGSSTLALHLTRFIAKRGSKRLAQMVIAKIVSIFDLLLANNTVAIIFSGEMARDIAKRYHVPPHYSAAWLDIFSCVFQGIIPYGAQVLLASTVAGISPLEIIGKVYFCYMLALVSLLHIFLKRNP